MPDEAVKYKTLRSWLEDSLRIERDALSLALARQHAELLRKLGPQLDGVPWTPSCDTTAWTSAVSLDRDCDESMRIHVPTAPTPLTCRPEAFKGPQIGATPHVIQPRGTFDDGLLEGSPWRDTNEIDFDAETAATGMNANRGTTNITRSSTSSRTVNAAIKRATSVSRDAAVAHLASFGDDPVQAGTKCGQLLASPQMETLFCFLIIINTMVMAAEFQYRGLEVGYQVGYPGSTSSAKDIWPWAEGFFDVSEWVFGVVFTIELLLKLSILRYRFLCEVWNFVDLVVVGAWLVGATSLVSLPLDPMLLRLVRLARLLRLLRIVRSMRLFDSLYLMTTSMRGSFSALFWSIILLSIVQMMLALFLQQVTEGYVMDEGNSSEQRRLVFKYYGSFARATLTMFEITLGNWMPPCRALFENVSEWYMLFSLAHKMIMGFSVVTVITAVFIQETFKVATIDDRIMVMSKERAKKAQAGKIQNFFSVADMDGDGYVDSEEFEQIMANPEVKMWLAAMDCDFGDCTTFFRMLDVDGDERVTFEELLAGVSAFRGAARSYDLAKLNQRVLDMQPILLDLQKRVKTMSTTQT